MTLLSHGRGDFMAKVYKDYFDIAHMIEYAKKNNVTFVFCCSTDDQRGCGKTYSSSKYLYEHALKGEKFMIFVREVKELGHIAEGVFSSYLSDAHPDTIVYEKKQDNIFSFVYHQVGTGDEKETEIIGFVAPLKVARNLKQYRGIFQSANVRYFYMDEFMPLDGRYLPDEPSLMKTIYDTVNGKIENLPIIMTANCINLQNPYFSLPGVRLNSKVQSNTRSIKTDTYIYENVCVQGLSEKHINSGINKAFGLDNESYLSNVWIGDNDSLVSKCDYFGRAVYIATLAYNNQKLALLEYPNVGLFYISRKVDSTCKYVYNLTMDGDLNIPLLKTCPLLKRLKDWFYSGRVRVSDGAIQRILLDIF